jgi:hypothetical protein
VSEDDLERILEAAGRPSVWDYVVDGASILGVVTSLLIAGAALYIAWNAERGRQAAERALAQERAEGRLREALREVIAALNEQARQINRWAAAKNRSGLGDARTNGGVEDLLLHVDEDVLTKITNVGDALTRPGFESLRGALDNALLAAEPTSKPAIIKLQELVFTAGVAPQWHAAAQHLTDISGAVARWGARPDAEDQFIAELAKIEAFYLEQWHAAHALRGTYR